MAMTKCITNLTNVKISQAWTIKWIIQHYHRQ